jgi:hypothetical protein
MVLDLRRSSVLGLIAPQMGGLHILIEMIAASGERNDVIETHRHRMRELKCFVDWFAAKPATPFVAVKHRAPVDSLIFSAVAAGAGAMAIVVRKSACNHAFTFAA